MTIQAAPASDSDPYGDHPEFSLAPSPRCLIGYTGFRSRVATSGHVPPEPSGIGVNQPSSAAGSPYHWKRATICA